MKLLFVSFFIILLTGCSYKKEITNFQMTSFDKIDGFYEDNLTYAFEVFKKNCEKSKRFDYLKNICAKSQTQTNAYKFFTENFTPYLIIDDKGNSTGETTGYYEPVLNGSFTKNDKYKYPIYEMPKSKDIGTRAQINSQNDFKAICYVSNETDLYLLHLQGSGKIKIDENNTLNLVYAGNNGKKYNSVGKYMIKKDYIKSHEATIQGMKKFLDENPKKISEILNQNERYIFFKVTGKKPVGSLGVELTPKRSIAVDTNYIKLGLPVFLHTKNPISNKDIKKVVIANDKGADIKGKIRADYFWGSGSEALKYAGRMKEESKLIVLMPK